MQDFTNDQLFFVTTILLGFVVSISKILEYLRYNQLSFIFEIIGLIFVNLFVIAITSNSPKLFSEIFGVSHKKWLIVISICIIISIPWWFEECVMIINTQVVRRALGIASFSTLIKAPIFEEFYFRGLLLWYLKSRYGKNMAAQLNGIIFSLMHLPFAFFGINVTLFVILLLTSIFGYVLALFQLKYQNILIPIALHMIANTVLILIGFPSIQSNEYC